MLIQNPLQDSRRQDRAEGDGGHQSSPVAGPAAVPGTCAGKGSLKSESSICSNTQEQAVSTSAF